MRQGASERENQSVRVKTTHADESGRKHPGATEVGSHSRRQRPNRAATHTRRVLWGAAVLWTRWSFPHERGGKRGAKPRKGFQSWAIWPSRVRVSSGGVRISARTGAH
jgi:hypothetical protein